LDTKHIEAGNEPLDHQADAGGPFSSANRLDITRPTIAFDRAAQFHGQQERLVE